MCIVQTTGLLPKLQTKCTPISIQTFAAGLTIQPLLGHLGLLLHDLVLEQLLPQVSNGNDLVVHHIYQTVMMAD